VWRLSLGRSAVRAIDSSLQVEVKPLHDLASAGRNNDRDRLPPRPAWVV
jgi:hypothetical protein